MEVNGEINKKVVGIKYKMRNTVYDGIWITNEYDKLYRLFYNYLIEILGIFASALRKNRYMQLIFNNLICIFWIID